MGVQELLAGLSGKMQEMTMKVGSRPYGCALLVCYLGEGECGMYRVDPSGAVVLISSVESEMDSGSSEEAGGEQRMTSRSVTLMGNWDALKQKRDLIRQQLETKLFGNEEQIQDLLVDAARQTFTDTDDASATSKEKRMPVLYASFTRQRGLEIKRIGT